MKRSGPLRARSRKREAIYRERRPLVARLLADQPTCQRCLTRPATDVHEIVSRARGGSILDVENLACLCRTCHDYITTHPAQAAEEGWSRGSWEQ